MNEINQLLADYGKEHERVNGRSPILHRTSAKSSWVELDYNKYRISDLRKMLAILKTRSDYSK